MDINGCPLGQSSGIVTCRLSLLCCRKQQTHSRAQRVNPGTGMEQTNRQRHGKLYKLAGFIMLIKTETTAMSTCWSTPCKTGSRPGRGRTLSSSSTGSTPKNGRVADPGFRAVAPGSGVIMWAPVSVCHQVSTIGVLPPPTTWNTIMLMTE